MSTITPLITSTTILIFLTSLGSLREVDGPTSQHSPPLAPLAPEEGGFVDSFNVVVVSSDEECKVPSPVVLDMVDPCFFGETESPSQPAVLVVGPSLPSACYEAEHTIIDTIRCLLGENCCLRSCNFEVRIEVIVLRMRQGSGRSRGTPSGGGAGSSAAML
ncbi:hypothetical protein ACFE04_026611 [Oxalis oulophora]